MQYEIVDVDSKTIINEQKSYIYLKRIKLDKSVLFKQIQFQLRLKCVSLNTNSFTL